MAQALRHGLLALQFYTRLPLPTTWLQWVGYSPDMQRRCSAHLPAIGLLTGGATAAAMVALFLCLPTGGAWVAATLAVGVSIGLTGALHEDALADTADGLGGGSDPQRVLAIMKDPHTGAFGVLALVWVVGLKVALLALLLQADWLWATAVTVMAHVVSRLAPVCCLVTLPYVRDVARSKTPALAAGSPRSIGWVAVLWWGVAMVVVWAFLPGAPWLGGHVAAALATGWMWRLQQRRLGGCTGDTLGATQQVVEVAFLCGSALALGPVWV